MKRISIWCLAIIALLLLSGCGSDNKKVEIDTQKVFLQTTDDAGRTVVIKEKPERIICLSPSFFSSIDALEGKLVGRASSNVGHIPDSVAAVPEVGFSYNVDTERIIALKPDCIIALEGQQNDLVKLFEGNNIPVLLLKVKTYDEVKNNLKLLGDIFGNKDKSDQIIQKLDADVLKIVDKIPHDNKKVVILHASAKNVTVELDGSIAGSVSNMLRFTNIAANSSPDRKMEKMPYSLEDLVKYNPDIIFITSMGTSESVEARLQKDVKSNPAWNSLEAVRNDKVYVLPEKLFLVNPGIKYPEAVAYMAKTVYPEAGINE